MRCTFVPGQDELPQADNTETQPESETRARY